MHIRPLADADLPALKALLAPTEARSVFLLGNAIEHGITDRGEPLHGLYLGAFEGASLRGVIAWARGPNSVMPACNGYAARLVPALEAQIGVAHVVLGTEERVAEALAHAPASWRPAERKREVLLVLEWPRYRPPADTRASLLPAERAAEGAELIGMLHREWSLPTSPEQQLRQAERLARDGRLVVREVDGRAIAMSCRAAQTGRFVHVGATACETAHRRRGHAGACVASVLERAREAGLATVGATLFTNAENVGALALYERMGFVRDVSWEMCFLAPP